MKLLLIQNSRFKNFISQYPFEATLEFPLIRREQEEKVLQNLEFDLLLSQIEDFDGTIEGLILSNWLTSEDENPKEIFHSAFELATYIRLSNKNVRHLPIAILSDLSTPDILHYGSDMPHILFASYGTKIISPDRVKWTVNTPEDDFSFDDKSDSSDQNLSQIYDKDEFDIRKFYHSEIREKIRVYDRASSGHDVANQWGAYRMAQVAGLEHKINHPKNLYFQYLLSNRQIEKFASKFELKECDPFYPKSLNILYIDDNHKNGWVECLEGVFCDKIMAVGNNNLAITSNTSLEDDEIDKIAEDKTYDLILLDYYLLNNEKGIDKLRKIKEVNPAIPVVMFTASNKAWNMDELYEAGADGYYVKEHPETAHDPEFSVKNFENFHKTVKNCLAKGELLGKYWRKIRDIAKSEVIKNKTDPSGIVQKNKERIHERLIMFLGLLKKAFEQTKFDESTFFYSNWELAFLTLWSTLNEIQEACYLKSQPMLTLTSSNGQKYTHHPGKNKLRRLTYITSRYTNHYKWIYKNDIFIEYIYTLKEKAGQPFINEKEFFEIEGLPKSCLKFDTTKQEYSIEAFSPRKVDYETTLHLQIAFLLIKMNARESLLTYLANLNSKVRNKLYLTHGDDSASPNFHEEYKNGRKTDREWKKHIQELFEIVYFLCTGKDCDWSV